MKHRSIARFWVGILLLSSAASTAANGGADAGAISHRHNSCLENTPSIATLEKTQLSTAASWNSIPRGGSWFIIPAGWNPFGYRITELGHEFLKFEGSLDSDVGRFLASLKTARKRKAALKAQWVEIVRVAKDRKTMRVYRKLQELLEFCLAAGLID